MIEQLTVKPGVVALRVQGHIGRQDVAKSFDLLMESIASRPKTSLFIEVANLTGFDTEALADDFKLGRTLLDKLDRFDRVAIVSDQSWVRWASRIESALLPGISYRSYTLKEREQALDWVKGRDDLPYGHALKIVPSTRPDVIGIELNGRLTREEVGQFARELNKSRQEQPLKAVLLNFRSLTDFDPGIVADGEYLRMKLGLLGELERYAIVGGPGWLKAWVELLRPLLRLELRLFPEGAEGAAWSWLSAKPLSDQSVAA
jgi:hypothetical protein